MTDRTENFYLNHCNNIFALAAMPVNNTGNKTVLRKNNKTYNPIFRVNELVNCEK